MLSVKKTLGFTLRRPPSKCISPDENDIKNVDEKADINDQNDIKEQMNIKNMDEKADINDQNDIKEQTRSKNSLVARSGNQAEDIVCQSSDILHALSIHYFKKRITKCEKIASRKKSDLFVTFEDNTHTTIQLKNGNGGGRGWSFDRRSVDAMPTTTPIKNLLKTVCLKAGGERDIVANDRELIKELLLGTEESTRPQHVLHTTIKNGKVQSLSVCCISDFMDKILKDVYETCNAKRTCVHLTPLIYLQRKGGGKADHSPNDIQAKLRAMPSDCMITISLD